MPLMHTKWRFLVHEKEVMHTKWRFLVHESTLSRHDKAKRQLSLS